MTKLSTIIATWFGSGYLQPASGTWGTLASLPLCLLCVSYLNQFWFICVSLILFFIGLWATSLYQKNTKKHDPSEVVVDETTGMMLASIPLYYQFDWIMVFVCFTLFRIFDAVKIGPVGWLDRNVNGSLGVMLDDIAAGIMTSICILGYLIWMN